jgi:hypothetical protein
MESLYIVPTCLLANTLFTYQCISPFEGYKKLKEAHKYELLNRITASLFQVFIVCNGMYMTSNNDHMRLTSQMTGYMIYELVYMPLYSNSVGMYLHHILYVLAFISHQYASQEDLEFFASASYILESTAPFLTLVWCLEKYEYPKNMLHKSIEAVAASYWSCIRIVVFPYIIYSRGSSIVYCFGIPLYLLQWYWFTLILKRATRTYARSIT